MPVVFTFDFDTGVDGKYRTYIQSSFTRLGWERLGNTAYRYPRLGTEDQPTEDWMNHVIPALSLFRAMVMKNGLSLKKYSLDVHTSTGFNPSTHGTAPIAADKSSFYTPEREDFGAAQLETWINNDSTFPY